MSTKPKSKSAMARKAPRAVWPPYDLNRPHLLDPRGRPYPVVSEPTAEEIIGMWRDLVTFRDDLVARVIDGDTRAQPHLSEFDAVLSKYPGPRVFQRLVRKARAANLDAAVKALRSVWRQVRSGALGRSDVDTTMTCSTPRRSAASTRPRSFAPSSRAGVTDFRFHDLRHTTATRLRRAGVGLDVVADVLGHATLSMARRYAHLGKETMRAAMAGLPSPVALVAPPATKKAKRRHRVEAVA